MNTLKTIGFEESATVPGMLRHATENIKIGVHVDDRICSGMRADLHWLHEELKRVYEVKCQMIGADADMDTDASYLNRTIRWTSDGN